jgi:hypothetical protein
MQNCAKFELQVIGKNKKRIQNNISSTTNISQKTWVYENSLKTSRANEWEMT